MSEFIFKKIEQCCQRSDAGFGGCGMLFPLLHQLQTMTANGGFGGSGCGFPFFGAQTPHRGPHSHRGPHCGRHGGRPHGHGRRFGGGFHGLPFEIVEFFFCFLFFLYYFFSLVCVM